MTAELKPEEKLEGCLSFFDSLNLEDNYTRRAAFKPLYDYFQVLLYEVACRYCSQDKNCLKNQGLEARWNMLNNVESLFEGDIERWKQIIHQIQNVRSRVEHNDDFIPEKSVLVDLRKNAPDFTQWLIEAGQKYYAKSANLSFIEEFNRKLLWYLSQADAVMEQYGEDIPFFAKISFQQEDYATLEALRETLGARKSGIHTLRDLKKEDLDNLSKLITRIERFDAQATTLLHFNVCAKCGGKISQTDTYVLGMNSSVPIAVVCRIGCEKCDYEVNRETIDL